LFMEDVLKVLKQIVSAFSSFGNVPTPVKVCVGLFTGIFGFSLIFVYARLDKSQMILLIGAIALMAVVTGIYFAWKAGSRKESDPPEWAEVSRENAPVAPTAGGAGQPTPTRTPAREAAWDQGEWQTPGTNVRHNQPPPSAVKARPEEVTLLDLTEPFFQFVCRLNRIARRGGASKAGDTTSFVTRLASGSQAAQARAVGIDEVVVRAEVKALLEDLLAKAGRDLRLSEQARQIELPLVFFVDSMISESTLPFAAQWNQNRLAYDRQELAGDEKFFDLLDENLKESGDDAAERLAVFYVCIGMGFTGIYFKQPELLRKMMLSIAPRIRHKVENDQRARICPEAYQGLDTRDLVAPPRSRMALIGLLFATCTLAVMVSYLILYRQASANLNHSIEEVLQQDLAVDAPK
jgi:type VI secretion system protein ImpK